MNANNGPGRSLNAATKAGQGHMWSICPHHFRPPPPPVKELDGLNWGMQLSTSCRRALWLNQSLNMNLCDHVSRPQSHARETGALPELTHPCGAFQGEAGSRAFVRFAILRKQHVLAWHGKGTPVVGRLLHHHCFPLSWCPVLLINIGSQRGEPFLTLEIHWSPECLSK